MDFRKVVLGLLVNSCQPLAGWALRTAALIPVLGWFVWLLLLNIRG